MTVVKERRTVACHPKGMAEIGRSRMKPRRCTGET